MAKLSKKDTRVYTDGRVVEEWYRRHRLDLHREDGPAQTYWFKNGNKEKETWYRDGLRYRENGPVVTGWYENGVKRSETYIPNYGSELKIEWDFDGNKVQENWFTCGVYNREDGPARTEWDKNGNVKAEEWIKNGKFIKDEVFMRALKEKRLKNKK